MLQSISTLVLRLVLAGAVLLPSLASAQATKIFGKADAGGLCSPRGVSVDRGSSNVFWAGLGCDDVWMLDPTQPIHVDPVDRSLPGNNPRELMRGTGVGGSDDLDQPVYTAVDDTGSVYVTGGVSDNVFKITIESDDTITKQLLMDGSDGLASPRGIAVDAAGNVYVASRDNDKVFMIPPGSPPAPVEILNAAGAGPGKPLDSPNGVATGPNGNVYVTAAASDNVFMVTDPGGPAETIREILTSVGDGSQSLDVPLSLVVDDAGRVFVNGLVSSNTFMITDPGEVTQTVQHIITAAGDGTNPVQRAGGVGIDALGNVFVSGWDSNNVFKITDPGEATQTIVQVMDITGDGSAGLADPREGSIVVRCTDVYVLGYDSHNGFEYNDEPCPPPTEEISIVKATAWPRKSKLGRARFEGEVPVGAIDFSGTLRFEVTDGDRMVEVGFADCGLKKSGKTYSCKYAGTVDGFWTRATFKIKKNPDVWWFRLWLKKRYFTAPLTAPLNLEITDATGATLFGTTAVGTCEVKAGKQLVCR